MNVYVYIFLFSVFNILSLELVSQSLNDTEFTISIIAEENDDYDLCGKECKHTNHGKLTIRDLRTHNFNDDVTLIAKLALRFYQIFISSQNQPSCMFEPSCSAFALESINSYGLRGVLMSADRVSRCNGMSYKHYQDDFKNGIISDPPEKYINK